MVDHHLADGRCGLEVYAAMNTSLYSEEDVALLWPLGPHAAHVLAGAPWDDQDTDERVFRQ